MKQPPVLELIWLRPHVSFANVTAELVQTSRNVDELWRDLKMHWHVAPDPTHKAYAELKEAIEHARNCSKTLAAEIRRQKIGPITLKSTRKGERKRRAA